MDAKKYTLAYEIAKALDDMGSLAVHEGLVEKYSEEFLLETLHKVLSIKPGKIHNLGAYYTSIVKRNARNSSYHPRS